MLMEKIGIFYGSTTGITESVAYRLAELMHVKKEDLHDVARSKPSEIGQYDLLLLGSSTRSEERRVGKECRSRWSPYH